jgi:hypothetical protein
MKNKTFAPAVAGLLGLCLGAPAADTAGATPCPVTER